MIINKLTDTQREQLETIIPSSDSSMECRPCQVILNNGDKIENVYIVEEKKYLETWGVMPDHDPNKRYVLIENVIEIKESPNRMPPDLANKIYKEGESGMGYTLFKIVFDNGQTLDVCTGNAVDFVPLPHGLNSKNIKDVLPHQASRENFTKGPQYYWCLFKGDTPSFV